MAKPSVDAFVKKTFPREQQPIVARLRALMRELAPKSEEGISYNMLVFHGQHLILAYVNSSKTHVTFSFTVGSQFEDKYGLLRGNAKHARYLRCKQPEDINKTVLRYYVRQALAHDRR